MKRITLAAMAGLCLTTLLLGSGCASTGKKQAEEARLRKARSHFDLGVDHLEHDRVALGLRELRAAVAIDPKNAQIHYALSEAYLRKGKVGEGEAHLVRALELHSEYHDARLSLSALYLNTERYLQAEAEAKVLIDDPTFPAPWRAYTNAGWAAYKEGRNGDARKYLEQSREFNASYWPTLLDLGILEAQEGHTLEAVSLFERVLALRVTPEVEAEVNYRLAEIYVAMGKRERAVGHLMAAVGKTPDGRWGKKSEEYLRLLR